MMSNSNRGSNSTTQAYGAFPSVWLFFWPHVPRTVPLALRNSQQAIAPRPVLSAVRQVHRFARIPSGVEERLVND
eukprot:CAMPEP_0119371258 /NCGR_PEP_ID=MMETSP1334-20130426/17473_1 /TAXON_ID=127549 /ORGANISM="Calcidiscus leptoporus, Strain RCC1130" /LENGTH=74 /DNA_ID=CAMNT_0007388499 /DNA_START=1186 /DNA_END=1407 /DNA_ORIENTATION=-